MRFQPSNKWTWTVAIMVCCTFCLTAKRVRTTISDADIKMLSKQESSSASKEQDIIPESFKLFGYDKPLHSAYETFFVENITSADTLTSIRIRLDYFDMSGKRIHARELEEGCMIPPGESRRLSVKSWDKTQTYYFFRNPPARQASREASVPYKISAQKIGAKGISQD